MRSKNHKVFRVTTALVLAALAYVGTVEHDEIGMRLERVAPLSLTLLPEAHADDAELGLAILKCFHPTGDFVRASITGGNEDYPGRKAFYGHIDFKGGFTGNSYGMDFVLHAKDADGDRLIRVTPGTDTAPFPPSATCRLREWTRIN